MTNANCLAAAAAAGYTLAGTEYAGECWADTVVSNGGGPASDGQTGCNMYCKGNATEICGGGNRLTAWAYGIPPSANASTTSTTTTSSSSTTVTSALNSSTVTSSTTSSSAVPTLQHVPSYKTYNWIGCYTEATNGRALNQATLVNYTAMTVEMCGAFCSPTYSMFGLEYAGEVRLVIIRS